MRHVSYKRTASAGLSEIMQDALQTAVETRKVQAASLHVAASNTGARALYSSLGFATEAVLESYYSSGEAAHKMALTLC